jgi:hypothetical protein
MEVIVTIAASRSEKGKQGEHTGIHRPAVSQVCLARSIWCATKLGPILHSTSVISETPGDVDVLLSFACLFDKVKLACIESGLSPVNVM